MTTGESTAAVLDRVLADHGDVAAGLADAHRGAWAVVDPRLLELCRLRVAMLLGCQDELTVRTPGAGLGETEVAELAAWPTSPRFDDRDRAVLAFAEQYVIDVASLGDDLAAAVAGHLGPDGLVDLASGLLVIEQRQRLRLAWERLFDDRSTT